MFEVQKAASELRAGRPESALAMLGDQPTGADALYVRAMSLSALGRTGEADEAFAAAIDAGAPKAEALSNQGRMHHRAGASARALSLFDQAAAAPNPPAPLPLDRAAALRALGRSDEAEAAYRAHLKGRPNDPGTLATLAGMLNEQRRWDEARALLDRALSKAPTHAIALNNRASVARASGEPGELDLLRRAAAAAPAHPDVQANRARAAVRHHQEEEAIEAFAAAIRQAPLRADIHRDLNAYLAERGRTDLFLRSYEVVPPGAPPEAACRLLTGAARLAKDAGDADGARARYEAALRLVPADPQALAGRARVAAAGDRTARWQAAYEAAPSDPEVRLGHAWNLLTLSAFEEAESVLAAPFPRAFRQEAIAYDAVAARVLGRNRYEKDHDLDRLVTARELTAPARYASLPLFMEAVAEALAPRFVTDHAPLGQTLFGGVQTPGDLFEGASEVLRDLRAEMLRTARAFWREVRAGPSCALTQDAPDDLDVSGAWSIRLRSGGGHKDHVHPEGVLSSAHYVRVPAAMLPAGATSPAGEGGERPGWLRLGRAPLDHPALAAEHHVRPEPGLLVLFPSYVWHGVEAFASPEDRVTTPADFA